MSEAKYPSKERVEHDGVLVYAEGDDLINDPDEAQRQGYDVDDPGDQDDEPDTGDQPVTGDEPDDDKTRKPAANKAMKPATNK